MLSNPKNFLIFLILLIGLIPNVQASHFEKLNLDIDLVHIEQDDIFNKIEEPLKYSENMQEAIKVMEANIDITIKSNPSCEYSPNTIGEMTKNKIVFWITVTNCEFNSLEEVLWFIEYDKLNKFWKLTKEIQISTGMDFKVSSIEIDDQRVLILGSSLIFTSLDSDDKQRIYDDAKEELYEVK